MKKLLMLMVVLGACSLSLALPVPIVEMGFQNDNLVNTGSAGETGYAANSTSPPTAPITFDVGVAGVGSRAASIAYSDELVIGSLGVGGGGVVDAFNGLKSFTMTMWIKTDSMANVYPFLRAGGYSGGAYARTDTFGRATAFIDGTWASPGYATNTAWWNNVSDWMFVAWTYDGTQTTDNLGFYWKGLSASTMGSTTKSLAESVIPATAEPLRFAENIAGLIDNIRVYGSKTDASGVLSSDDLMAIANSDAVAEIPEPATIALLLGGSFFYTFRRQGDFKQIFRKRV